LLEKNAHTPMSCPAAFFWLTTFQRPCAFVFGLVQPEHAARAATSMHATPVGPCRRARNTRLPCATAS
jgi:hypothetical protein